jgi:PilZ domain
MAAVIRDTREMSYLVLTDRAVPYLLARLRWPDVAQAMTVSSPRWLEDPGLFDLHYDCSAVNVSFSQAASVAAGWGAQLRPEPAAEGPVIRRMSSSLHVKSRRNGHARSIRFVGRRRGSSRRVPRLQSASERAALASGAVHGPDSALLERRRYPRVRVDGRAHIRSEPASISARLVDLSQGGMRFVQLEPQPALTPGAALEGPFLFEAEGNASRICLDVAGRIVWRRTIGARTHYGVAFRDLADAENEGLRLFLAAVRN